MILKKKGIDIQSIQIAHSKMHSLQLLSYFKTKVLSFKSRIQTLVWLLQEAAPIISPILHTSNYRHSGKKPINKNSCLVCIVCVEEITAEMTSIRVSFSNEINETFAHSFPNHKGFRKSQEAIEQKATKNL